MFVISVPRLAIGAVLDKGQAKTTIAVGAFSIDIASHQCLEAVCPKLHIERRDGCWNKVKKVSFNSTVHIRQKKCNKHKRIRNLDNWANNSTYHL